MHEVEVIESPAAAIAALDPIRTRLLRELATPHSAASLAAKLGIPRQKLNYHLRQLEAHGLVELHDTRAHGGLTERVLAATAAAFFVDPALGGGEIAPVGGDRVALVGDLVAAGGEIAPVGGDREAAGGEIAPVGGDRAALGGDAVAAGAGSGRSSAAAAGRAVADDRLSARYLIAVAARAVREVGRLARRGPVATLTIDTEIGFASPDDRAAFAGELTAAVTQLAAKYHHDDGRAHRLVVAAHPLPEEDATA